MLRTHLVFLSFSAAQIRVVQSPGTIVFDFQCTSCKDLNEAEIGGHNIETILLGSIELLGGIAIGGSKHLSLL